MQNSNQKIDPVHYELFEKAQRRVKQKRLLLFHFCVFIIGSIFMVVINKFLYPDVGYNWYVWGILIWAFLFLLHLANVFVINRFMGKEWERKQCERLVELQQKKISKLETKIEQEFQKEATSLAVNSFENQKDTGSL
ncbi:MAG: 2TM domain-containing protein [Bacteroidota bacterium]|nr:2TM domain-containing protein [Bacteroidota bacterium]